MTRCTCETDPSITCCIHPTKGRMVDTLSDESKITYSANWMGSLTDPRYSGGRIDIRGLDKDEYYSGWHEYGLPLMATTSWYPFAEWLNSLETERLLAYEEIIQRFESETGNTIRWWSDE